MSEEDDRAGAKAKTWILNETNYHAWSIRMKQCLIRKDCWEPIEGYDDIERDADGDPVLDEDGNPKLIAITAKERARRRKLENLAREQIYEKISDAILEEVDECETAKEIWDHLSKANTSFDFIYEIKILKELLAVKKTDDLTAQAYIKKILDLNRSLSQTLEISLSPKALAGIAVAGLPDKYDQMIRVMDKTKLDIAYVKAQIHQEDLNLKQKEKENEADAVALAVQNKRVTNFKNKQNNPPKTQEKKNNEDKPEYFCYNCYGRNHIAKHCTNEKDKFKKQTPQKKEENPEKPKQEMKRANTVYEDGREEVALCVHKQDDDANKKVWILDNAACNHMTAYKELFVTYKPCNDYVYVADDRKLSVIGKGDVMLDCIDECGGKNVRLQNVYHIPDLGANLISMGQIDNKGHKITIENGRINIFGKGTESLFLSALKKGALWFVYTMCSMIEEKINEEKTKYAARVSLDLWHRRFAHCNKEALVKIPQLELKRTPKAPNCETCSEAKIINPPFPKKSEKRSDKVLDLIHSDVGGKYTPKSLGNAQYYVTFIDDYSQYTKVYVLKNKDEVFGKFLEYQAEVELLHGCSIKALQCDNGTEYVNNPFKEHLKEKGIRLFRSVPYQPQQNGKSEKMNRTLMTTVRCMLVESGLPKAFWAEALRTACFNRNRCPSAAIDYKIPEEVWTGKPVNLEKFKMMKIFGCQVYAGIAGAKKLESQAEKCVNLGVEENMKGYRLWSIKRNKIISSRTVVFQEDKFPYKKEEKTIEANEEELSESSSSGEEDLEEDPEEEDLEEKKPEEKLKPDPKQKQVHEELHEDVHEEIHENIPSTEENEQEETEQEETEEPVLRRSTRLRKPKVVCTEECCKPKNTQQNPKNNLRKNIAYCVTNMEPIEPKTFEDAKNWPNAEEWEKSMGEEMQSMKLHQAWDIVPRPQNKNIIGCKWVYKIKKNEKGEITKYKSRLVAKGFAQVKGVDYKETYSPVLMKKSIRILLAVAVDKNYETRHIDVLSAYLNSPIKEEVYMEQPKGYEIGGSSYVCKLRKSIYGLHQSGRDWSMHITNHLMKMGFERCVNEPCMFHKEDIILGLYVDDILAIGTKKAIEDFLKKFEKIIDFRDLGEVKCILSLNVKVKKDGIIVYQEPFASQLIHQYGINSTEKATSPLPLNVDNEENDEKPIDITEFKQAIGSLLYLSNNTRPDLAYAVCALSQRCCNPTERDWRNVCQVLKYLNATLDVGLNFSKTGEHLQVYVDSSWANQIAERRSIYGVILLLSGSVISWYAKKSQRVSNSVLQAEYVAMDEGVREVLWIQHLFEELKLVKLVPKPTVIYGDNQGAIANTTKQGITEKTKHFDTMLHFQRECCMKEEVVFKYVESARNYADALTKSISGPKMRNFRNNVMLMPST